MGRPSLHPFLSISFPFCPPVLKALMSRPTYLVPPPEVETLTSLRRGLGPSSLLYLVHLCPLNFIFPCNSPDFLTPDLLLSSFINKDLSFSPSKPQNLNSFPLVNLIDTPFTRFLNLYGRSLETSYVLPGSIFADPRFSCLRHLGNPYDS